MPTEKTFFAEVFGSRSQVKEHNLERYSIFSGECVDSSRNLPD